MKSFSKTGKNTAMCVYVFYSSWDYFATGKINMND